MVEDDEISRLIDDFEQFKERHPERGEGGREKMDRAAFWLVEGEYGTRREPVDGRAVYGTPSLGDRDEDEITVPVRKGVSNLIAAIRTLSQRHSPKGETPDDRVRVNDGGWMEVVRADDEGFVAHYEDGSVDYAIWPTNPSNNPQGTFDHPWMRRVDDWSSAGGVDCIEVDWDT